MPQLIIDNDVTQPTIGNIMRAVTASTLVEALPKSMIELLDRLGANPKPTVPTLRLVA